MRRLSIAFLVGILAIMMLAPVATSAASQTHTVQYGETLTSIAAQYGVSVDSLAQTNGISSPNLIFVGQVLTIPGQSAPSAPQTGGSYGNTYVVQPGDNLSSIAARYGVSLDALASANSLSNTNFIWSGERLTIPGQGSAPAAQPSAPAPAAPAPAKPASGTSYTVQAGDNLSAIAARYGVDATALAQANGITNPNLLYSGQTLTIPGRNDTSGRNPPPSSPQQPAPPPAKPTAAPPPPPPAQAPTPTVVPAAPTKAAPPPPASKPAIIPAVGSVTKYTVQAGDVLYSIAARYNTTVDAIMARNHLANANVITSGQVLEILVGDKVSKPANPPAAQPPATTPNSPTGKDTSPPVIDKGNGGKWIDVNISTQTLTAYEGSTPVFSTLVSTGIAAHPTVVGTYHIYAKYLADDMSGGTGAEYYYLPNVPYTMYFYEGYAIHGTYWHHNFGHPMSHGCVNLPTPAAQWMYNWAPMGTTVVTHW